jgi:hypothetical protein
VHQACESLGLDLTTYGHNHSGTKGTLPDHILTLGTHPTLRLTGLHTFTGSFFGTDYFSDHLPLVCSFQIKGGLEESDFSFRRSEKEEVPPTLNLMDEVQVEKAQEWLGNWFKR